MAHAWASDGHNEQTNWDWNHLSMKIRVSNDLNSERSTRLSVRTNSTARQRNFLAIAQSFPSRLVPNAFEWLVGSSKKLQCVCSGNAIRCSASDKHNKRWLIQKFLLSDFRHIWLTLIMTSNVTSVSRGCKGKVFLLSARFCRSLTRWSADSLKAVTDFIRYLNNGGSVVSYERVLERSWYVSWPSCCIFLLFLSGLFSCGVMEFAPLLTGRLCSSSGAN